jgi:hypothetical protein
LKGKIMPNDTAEQQSQETVLDPTSDKVVVYGGIKVKFTASGGIDVYGNVPVTLYPPANDSAPQAQPTPAGDHDKTSGKDAWLTKEFIASAQQGQKLPDSSVYIKLKDGSHWAVAANVATPRSYGWGDDLGAVGQWMAEQNQSNVHGHADWQMPNSQVGRAIYDARNKGELKAMFASVRGLWLAGRSNISARVQWFDDGYQLNGDRGLDHSVCAVRRLDI